MKLYYMIACVLILLFTACEKPSNPIESIKDKIEKKVNDTEKMPDDEKITTTSYKVGQGENNIRNAQDFMFEEQYSQARMSIDAAFTVFDVLSKNSKVNTLALKSKIYHLEAEQIRSNSGRPDFLITFEEHNLRVDSYYASKEGFKLVKDEYKDAWRIKHLKISTRLIEYPIETIGSYLKPYDYKNNIETVPQEIKNKVIPLLNFLLEVLEEQVPYNKVLDFGDLQFDVVIALEKYKEMKEHINPSVTTPKI